MDTLRSDRRPAEIDPALLESVVEHAHGHLAAAEASQFADFVRQYYRWVPAEDLAGRGSQELYGAALAPLAPGAGARAAGEAAIRVYNPDVERHGWQSSHTVIEIVSDDMPFLVDSVTMALNRAGVGIHLMIHPVLRVRRDDGGRLLEVLPPDGPADAAARASRCCTPRSTARPTRPAARRSRRASPRCSPRSAPPSTDWAPMRERMRDDRRRARARRAAPTPANARVRGLPALARRQPLHVPRLRGVRGRPRRRRERPAAV